MAGGEQERAILRYMSVVTHEKKTYIRDHHTYTGDLCAIEARNSG